MILNELIINVLKYGFIFDLLEEIEVERCIGLDCDVFVEVVGDGDILCVMVIDFGLGFFEGFKIAELKSLGF